MTIKQLDHTTYDWSGQTWTTGETWTTDGTGITTDDSTWKYNITWDNRTLLDKINDAVECERIKEQHDLQDFCIVADTTIGEHPVYLFITKHEAQVAQQHGIKLDIISSPTTLSWILKPSADGPRPRLMLSVTGEQYDNIDDLKKDYKILKISGAV